MRRFIVGTVCGWILLIGQLVFLSTQDRSPWHYLIALSAQRLGTSVQDTWVPSMIGINKSVVTCSPDEPLGSTALPHKLPAGQTSPGTPSSKQ